MDMISKNKHTYNFPLIPKNDLNNPGFVPKSHLSLAFEKIMFIFIRKPIYGKLQNIKI